MTCVIWCTIDVSFIFVVGWVPWVSGGGGGGVRIDKSARKERHEKWAGIRYINYACLRNAAFPWALSHFSAIRRASSRA